MLRRKRIAGFVLAVFILGIPAGFAVADDREWEQDYTDQPSDNRSPDDLDVSVDVGGGGGVTYDTFHGALSPYGEWVSVGAYGQVWRPRVAAGWRPYYQGRWAYDDFYGWVWVPGYQWAPAWVSWRYSGDVVGWAPLAPGFSIYVSSYPLYEPCWTFVPTAR